MNRPAMIRSKGQVPLGMQLDAATTTSEPSPQLECDNSPPPPPYAPTANSISQLEQHTTRKPPFPAPPPPPFPQRRPLRHQLRLNQTPRRTPPAMTFNTKRPSLPPTPTHPTPPSPSQFNHPMPSPTQPSHPHAFSPASHALAPSKSLLESFWRLTTNRFQLQMQSLQAVLQREESLRTYCIRLKRERDEAKRERDAARERVSVLVGDLEGLRREGRVSGVKRSRDMVKADEENDSECSGGDDGDSSSCASCPRDSRRNSSSSTTSTLINELPSPPTSASNTTNNTDVDSPCLLRNVTPPSSLPSPLAPSFKFPATVSAKRDSRSRSYSSPPPENNNDHDDAEGTRSPKRRRMSKEPDGDTACLNLNLNTGVDEKETDVDMEVEMDCREEAWRDGLKVPSQTMYCKGVTVKEECPDDMDMKDRDRVRVKPFSPLSPPISPTTTTTKMVTGARTNISISHIDLLYQATPDRMICRMCLRRRHYDPDSPPPVSFPSRGATWADLTNHCEEDHPGACEDLAKLTVGQVVELRQRMAGGGLAGLGWRR